MNYNRMFRLAVAAALAMFSTPVLALEWKDYLQTTQYFEGDSNGTSVDDIYLDSTATATNMNGQGLITTWGPANEKPAYIRFDNVFNAIPEGSIIYKATLQLTASAPGSGAGMLLAGARGTGTTINQNAATYANVTGRNSNQSQIYADAFGATLSDGNVVNMNITPAVRAWLDNAVNPAHGFANNGLAININPNGAGGAGGTLSFYDSETGNLNFRPRLLLEYLPPTSQAQPFTATYYLPTATDTAQVISTTAQDAMIRYRDTNAGAIDQQDNNFGARPNAAGLNSLDGASLLLRYLDLTAPDSVDGLAGAEFRFNGNSGWNVVGHALSNFELREVLQNWVEGVGNNTPVAGVTYDSFNRSDADPNLNPWSVAGALGATDSIVLAGNNFIGFQNDEMIAGSDDLLDLVSRWLAGEENNGLMLRGLSTNRKQILQFNASGDPYTSAGLLLVFNTVFPPPVPEPTSGLLLLTGIGVLAKRYRRRSR